MIPSTCICGSKDFTAFEEHGLSLNRCNLCKVVHQPVAMTDYEYADYYRHNYHDEVYTHSYDHDLVVANKRLKTYDILSKTTVLDVGCGTGAFVHAARAQFLDCDGVDLCVTDEEDLYSGQLADIHFPTDHYDVVTLHDVLEHIPDPTALLKEIRRVLTVQGRLIIDFPLFFVPEGEHHWKETEHLWFFNMNQLQGLLGGCGFSVVHVDDPIPSKMVLTCKVKEQPKRTTILVPPGIGDSYWVMAKMESFLEVHSLETADVFVSSTRRDRNRAHDYIMRHPFINAAGYCDHIIKNEDVWKEAYQQDGRSEFYGVLGHDFFLSTNGPFRFGKSLNEILPEYDTNWYPDMFVSRQEKVYGRRIKDEYGPYVVAFFSDAGMYKHWLEQLPPSELYRALAYIHDATGCKIILTGASWDLNDVNTHIMNLDAGHGRVVDLIGQTSLEEFFGLLRASDGCIGFCGGNTIMSTVFKVPTVIIWNRYFDTRFFTNACPPDSLGNWYLPADTADVDGFSLSKKLIGLML